MCQIKSTHIILKIKLTHMVLRIKIDAYVADKLTHMCQIKPAG
ncbi:MAG TPA: hypothetical protein PLI57_09545 [Spirochaetota bacterium]|nr:hypothetical protein [Spirochaetota bacterium]